MEVPIERIVPFLSPNEIVKRIRKAGPDSVRRIIHSLDRKKLRLVLKVMQEDDLEKLKEDLGIKDFVNILVHLKDQEAVRILRRMGKQSREEVMEHLPERERMVYSFILNFSKDSVGGWTRVDFPRAKVGERVWQVRERLKEWDGYKDYVVVETENGTLVGVVPLSSLLGAKRTEKIEDLAVGAETIDIDADSEELARLFIQLNPDVVVAVDDGKVMGIVTREEAIPLLEKEHEEDIAKMFSVQGIEHVWTPLRKALKNRAPWLVINLFTAFLAAGVVNIFENTLKNFVLLAVFMPIVPGEAGNATTQTMAIIVRGLATGDLDRVALGRVFLKEFLLGLIDGILVGIIAFFFTLLWKGNVLASLALSLAMPISLVVAGLIGVAIPLILKKAGQDPASSSTIILTTFTDMTGFFTFLGIATLLLKIMGM